MQQFLPCSQHRCLTHIPLHLQAITANGLFWWRKLLLLGAAKGNISSCTVRFLQQWNVGAGGTTELSNVNYILYYPQIWLVINYANLPCSKLAPSMWTFEQIIGKWSLSWLLVNLNLLSHPQKDHCYQIKILKEKWSMLILGPLHRQYPNFLER